MNFLELETGGRSLLLGAIAVLAAGSPDTASAQSAVDNSDAVQTTNAQAAKGRSKIVETTADDASEVVVTAQRRNEQLEDVPMSISTVSARQIQSAGITSLRDLAMVAPGFQLAASGIFPQPTIRGVSASVSNFFDNNVAVYVDGLYQSAPMLLNVDLPNVASIEVLKGPQGTLYGRNATGGAVLINTLDPTDQFQAKGELTYARFNDRRASAYVSGPLGDRVSVGVAGNIRHGDGYYKLASRTVPGAIGGNAAPIRQEAIRGKIRFEASEQFSATLIASRVYISDTRTNVYTPIQNVLPTILTNGAYATTPTKPGVYAFSPQNIGTAGQTEVALKLELRTGIGTIHSTTGYADTVSRGRLDFDGTFAPGTFVANDPIKNHTFQQSIDYTIDAINRVQLLAGFLYVDGVLDGFGQTWAGDVTKPGTKPLTLANDYAVLLTNYWRDHRSAVAGYADATWNIFDHLYLNVGGRFSSERLTATRRTESGLPSLQRIPVATGETFRKFTPRASLRYEFSPRASVYASYSQGFRGGNYNNAMPACVNTTNGACFTPARQEVVDTFEVGFKMARTGLRFDAAGFYSDYRQMQIANIKEVNRILLLDLTNAPTSKIYGAEASITAQPIRNLTLTAGGTWLHARYGSGFSFPGTGVNPAVVGLNVNADPLRTYGNQSQTQDLSGKMLTRSPNFSGNLGLEYAVPQDRGGWNFATNMRFTTKYIPNNPSVWGTAAGVPVARQGEQRFVQNGYAQVNASIMYTTRDGKYSLRLWGTNLTGKQYLLNLNNSTYGTYMAWSDPLSVGGTIGIKI